jgi:peptidoglycan hydrolase-like protein with peptidoglycan-binding domain
MMARRWFVPTVWAVTVGAAGLLGYAAAQAAIPDVEAQASTSAPVLYEVVDGTVERVLSFAAEAHWQITPAARNGAAGTVTSRNVEPGAQVDVGARLYSVDLRPTILGEGEIPSFRDLALGATGADVRQLQRLLADLGYLDVRPTGSFDALTESAVKAWQRGSGVPDDGVVNRGDVIYLSVVPARIRLSEDLGIGTQVAGGELAVELLSDEPTFTITLAPEQADLVPLTGPVNVRHATGAWSGEIAESTIDADGQLVLVVRGANGRPICGNDCEAVPFGAASLHSAEIVVVPETSGPTVPVAALRTTPSGDVEVVNEDGEAIPVRVVASAQGRAVLDGLPTGTVIRLFAGSSAQVTSPSPSSQ